MKLRLLAILSGSLTLAVGQPLKETAEEKPIETPKETTTDPDAIPKLKAKDAENKHSAKPAPPKNFLVVSTVEQAIPNTVKALGEPAMTSFPLGIHMAVTTTSEKAQEHVNEGINQLHGGWEFEAARHFAAAMREDPDCLLAHWGMVMSLLTPSPETGAARNAATDRLYHLIEQGKGTELERAYAYGLVKYIEEGPAGAASAFRKVSAKFPNDMQASMFASLFQHSGYDELGTATPDQQAAENSLLNLIKKYPTSPLPLNALLTIRAEAPDLNNSLPLARKLCEISPNYPPYLHLLGHYEWRCGNYNKAAAAFEKAADLYQAWMKDNKASVADCPEWVKSECYRIVSFSSKGDFDAAYASARKIASTDYPKKRLSSPGVRLLFWDAKTLPARLLLHRGFKGSARDAMDSLPKPEELKEIRKYTLAYWWIDGLRMALEGQRLISTGDLSGAKEICDALTVHGEAMAKRSTDATISGERSAWARSFRALEVLASELRGRLAMAGPKARIGPAYNWFSSAADRQHPESMMFPPMILTPMRIHVGEYYLAAGKPKDAVDEYERALAAFPNNMDVLTGLKHAYDEDHSPEKSAGIEKQIQKLQASE
jgi:tetratricopeptide (TPR) repeat protein